MRVSSTAASVAVLLSSLVLLPGRPWGQTTTPASALAVHHAMYGGDAQHTGRTPHRGPHTTPTIVWRVRTGRRVFASPAVTCEGVSVVASLDGTVLALDRHGVERWAYHAPGRVFASPALVGETAIVGYDGGAYVAIGPRGVPVWTYPTTEDADAPPMVALDGTVFVASATVAALDAGGHARWTLPLAGHAFGPPALTPDGRTVVVTELPGAVDFVDAATGHTGHRVQLPAPTRGGVLVLDNGAVVVGADDGHLRCITTEGTTRWDVVVGSATAHAGIRATPALGRDGTVIVGSEDGGIHGVRATDGGTVFNVATGGPVRSSARVDGDGWIYVGSEDDNVWALHPDGTVGWTASLGNDVDGTPAIPVDGLLVVSCDDGGIYGLGEAPPRD